MGEENKPNDEEFDYIYYTYGLNLYGNVPMVEPLEYKDIKKSKGICHCNRYIGILSGKDCPQFPE